MWRVLKMLGASPAPLAWEHLWPGVPDLVVVCCFACSSLLWSNVWLLRSLVCWPQGGLCSLRDKVGVALY